jgi:integrase
MLAVGEYEPWPEDVLAAALAADDDRVRLAVHLLLYTAQRIGDVVRMKWTDIRDGRIEVRQQKTGRALSIPLHARLAPSWSATAAESATSSLAPARGRFCKRRCAASCRRSPPRAAPRSCRTAFARTR